MEGICCPLFKLDVVEIKKNGNLGDNMILIYEYMTNIVVFLLNISFYGFIISLFFVAIINRYLCKYSNTIVDNPTSSNENIQSNNNFHNTHSGIIGVLGRTVINYIRFSSIVIGYIPLHCVRVFLYKHVFLIRCGNSSVIHYGLSVMGGEKIEIDSNTIIGDMCTLDGRNGLSIGKNVNFSSKVCVYTEQHDYKNSDFSSHKSKSFSVKINDYAWIGPNVIILPGVTIGEGAVVGAGSIVTKDIEPYTLAVGIPAKSIAQRPMNLNYTLGSHDIVFY